MKSSPFFIIGGAAAILILATQSFFIVDQPSQAILLQLGQPVGYSTDTSSYIKQPGLHFKLPFVQEVRYFDRRVLAVDPPPEQVVVSSPARNIVQPALATRIKAPVIAADGTTSTAEDGPVIENVTGEPIIVDTFARYRITDPLQFLKTLRTVSNANGRLESILNDSTRTVLGRTTLKTLLSPDRESVMNDIKDRVNKTITEAKLGIEMVDVRIVRADLTADLRTSTVRRMISELKERATETRAVGEERAQQIRAEAERERTVILAEAQRTSEILKGEGDEQAIKIYAEAFNRDPNFYAFLRSMEAYRNTLSNGDTQMILSPDNPFLRYLQNNKLP